MSKTPMANADTQTTTARPIFINTNAQMTLCPRQRMAVMQTVPPDEEQLHTSKNIKVSTSSNPTIVPDPQPEPQCFHSALLHDELVKTPEQKITPTPQLVPEPSQHFDWAEDAKSLPIISQLPLPP
jgi:hypothetical protein